jgi:hypothetical protein
MIAQTEGKAAGLGVVVWGLPPEELDRMKKEMESAVRPILPRLRPKWF